MTFPSEKFSTHHTRGFKKDTRTPLSSWLHFKTTLPRTEFFLPSGKHMLVYIKIKRLYKLTRGWSLVINESTPDPRQAHHFPKQAFGVQSLGGKKNKNVKNADQMEETQ